VEWLINNRPSIDCAHGCFHIGTKKKQNTLQIPLNETTNYSKAFHAVFIDTDIKSNQKAYNLNDHGVIISLKMYSISSFQVNKMCIALIMNTY